MDEIKKHTGILDLWETLNNHDFNSVEFNPLLSESGKNSFIMSPTRWANEFQAIGIRTKATKNLGTFAHKDIALEFASWISPEIKLYIIKELQRLKSTEIRTIRIAWQKIVNKNKLFLHMFPNLI